MVSLEKGKLGGPRKNKKKLENKIYTTLMRKRRVYRFTSTKVENYPVKVRKVVKKKIQVEVPKHARVEKLSRNQRKIKNRLAALKKELQS